MKASLLKLSKLAGSGAVVALALAAPAFALQYETGNFTSGQLINQVAGLIEIAAGILFVILLLIGGIQYLGSFGNEEATTKARKLIIDAVVGLVIVVAAGALAHLVFTQLGVGTGLPGGVSNIGS